MKLAAKYILLPVLFLFIWKANAKVQWSEPEVVPEKLERESRRVMRFSGQTSPGALVRIRKNRLKLFLDNGRSRWASIPQKNKVQFPVIADDSGHFSFNLYLPTVAVEIPIEVKDGKKWKPFTLNFRVPNSGTASDFEAFEDSFRARENEKDDRFNRTDNYYSRKQDRGLLIQDRDGNTAYDDSTFQAWGGLGISYFNTSVDTPAGNISRSGSAVIIPSFRFGLDWDYSEKIRGQLALRSTSGSTDDIGSSPIVTGNDFNWLEVQASVVWFSDMLKMKKGRLGFDFGYQMQSLPFFRERANFINLAYFDNDIHNFHLGLFYQEQNNKVWNYEMYGRYLYPFVTSDSFDIESSFPLQFELGGGIKRSLTPGLAFGVFGQFHYISMDVKYDNNNLNMATDLSLMLFTVDVRLIANF